MAELTKNNNILVPIKGKIQEVYEFKKKDGGYLYETIVVIPNADEYQGPLRLSIRSVDKELGKVGHLIEITTRMQSRYWKSEKDGKVNFSPELWLNQ
ncbi:MAG: hypothetical protein KKB30_09965 [Proteobacteria bacterium]|nr:hypothetical protein [Pseudomonadota bacterium]MBU1716376.1 hypothetical protein [Pseudomonadota bacterium]